MRREASASTYVPLQPEDISASNPFSYVPSQLDLTDLTPKVLEILYKGVYLQSSLLVQYLES